MHYLRQRFGYGRLSACCYYPKLDACATVSCVDNSLSFEISWSRRSSVAICRSPAVGKKAPAGLFQAYPKRLGLGIKPVCMLTRRIDLEFEINIYISLRKSIRYYRRKARICATECEIDDIAVARGFDIQVSSLANQPATPLDLLRLPGFHPLLPDSRAFIHS